MNRFGIRDSVFGLDIVVLGSHSMVSGWHSVISVLDILPDWWPKVEECESANYSSMDTITFVTGNANKLKEVIAILGGDSGAGSKVGKFEITNVSLDLEEIQGTIEEVTIHKAKSAAKALDGPVLVEDTCLAFTAFNDLPGPYIKWFVQAIGLQGLVDMLYKFEDKSAKAVCTFGFCEGPDSEVKLFQGTTEGHIVSSRGPTHFGWDSVFEPTGYTETYAEMDKTIKNTISHRFRALDKLREYLLSQ